MERLRETAKAVFLGETARARCGLTQATTAAATRCETANLASHIGASALATCVACAFAPGCKRSGIGRPIATPSTNRQIVSECTVADSKRSLVQDRATHTRRATATAAAVCACKTRIANRGSIRQDHIIELEVGAWLHQKEATIAITCIIANGNRRKRSRGQTFDGEVAGDGQSRVSKIGRAKVLLQTDRLTGQCLLKTYKIVPVTGGRITHRLTRICGKNRLAKGDQPIVFDQIKGCINKIDRWYGPILKQLQRRIGQE
jgi:hypothetical protein